MNGWIRPGLAAALVAAAALTAGCAPQLDRIEVGVQENRDEIALLQAENKRMTQEVQALGQLLRMDRDAGDESSAMRLAKLEQVSTRLDQLLQRLDDNAQYMRDLSARVDLLATRAGIATLGEYKEYAPPGGAGPAALPEEGRAILEAAELDRSRGNVDLARSGFTEFLEKYPQSEAADRAIYWLADLDYGEGREQEALDRYQELIEGYPHSEFQPAALYKARACLLALGRQEEAWAYGSRLLEQHPESDEAAQLRLERGDG
jgi:TolA-binding protein